MDKKSSSSSYESSVDMNLYYTKLEVDEIVKQIEQRILDENN